MTLRRVGVTGASGMVGRHLLALLGCHGIAAVATSRTPPAAEVEWRRSDVTDWRDPDSLDALFPDVAAVVHLAAILPGEASAAQLIDANVRATLVLGQWALARGKPLVFLSSGSVYGETVRPVRESDPLSPLPLGGLYGLSKQLAEQALGHLAARGLACTVLRPTAIYGWGMPAEKMVAAFLSRALAGAAIDLEPPTEDRVNLVHAADVAAAILAALQSRAGGTFNIAGPARVSILDLAEACVRVAAAGRIRIGDTAAGRSPIDRFQLDPAKAAEILGYAPRIGLDPGLDLLLRQTCLPDTEFR